MDPEYSGDHQSHDPTCDGAKMLCNDLNEEGFFAAQEAGCDFQDKGAWLPLEFPTGPEGSLVKDCSVAFRDNVPKYNAPSDEGCWVFAGDFDFGQNDNDCAYATVKAERIINGDEFLTLSGGDPEKGDNSGFHNIKSFSSKESYGDWKFGGPYDYDHRINTYCMIQSLKWKWNGAESYICADDHYWHKCLGSEEEDPNDLGTLTWANFNLYNCTIDEETNFPYWKRLLGEDKDQDGYTTDMGDCADDPEDPRLQQIGCPTLDIDTGEINCEPYQQYSKCAICI
ncbi:hypothetical protein KKG31_01315, partial [Patescibacteria group bacterium]|nr:hypothetical protein [Patescibacteria group bacterium]